MPDRLETGTPNTPGIAGLLAGLEYITSIGMNNIRNKEHALLTGLYEGLKQIPKVCIYGPTNPLQRIAVLPINIEGMDCGELSYILDKRYGILARSGLHCTPLAHQTLGTTVMGACRFSPGYFNSLQDIEQVIKAVAKIAGSI